MILEVNGIMKTLVPVAIIIVATTYYYIRVGRYRKRLFILGYISARWKMRFLRRGHYGSIDPVVGFYYGLMGHTRSVSSVLTGRQHSIPLDIFDYRYELGSRSSRHVVKKTVVVTHSAVVNPPLLILYDKSLLPFGRYSSYKRVNLDLENFKSKIKPEIRSYLKKCNIYSSEPQRAEQLFNEKFLSQLGRLKAVDIELCDNTFILWSDLVISKYLLIQHAARAIGCTRILNANIA